MILFIFMNKMIIWFMSIEYKIYVCFFYLNYENEYEYECRYVVYDVEVLYIF